MLQNYKNILVPVDGSYDGTRIHLVHVVDTRAFQNISSFDTAMVEQVTDTAKQTMQEYIEDAKKSGFSNIDYSVEYGAPKAVIAKELPDHRGYRVKRGRAALDWVSNGTRYPDSTV